MQREPPDVGPLTRLRGNGRRECFDQSEAEWEVQARSVRSEQRDAKGRALQSPGRVTVNGCG